MSRRIAALTAGLAVAIGIATPATAMESEYGSYNDVLGQCAPDDDLVLSATYHDWWKDGQLHHRLSGTITRTGTGRSGTYTETQLDKSSETALSFSGSLSRLVVPGSGVYNATGHFAVTADGRFVFTPSLASLDTFVSDVCALLA